MFCALSDSSHRDESGHMAFVRQGSLTPVSLPSQVYTSMLGHAVSDDYDPQLDNLPYPLDPHHWLRSSKVRPLVKLAVDPKHFSLWLQTASLTRLKMLIAAAHPFLLKHVVRFADGDPPEKCTKLLYYIGELSRKVPDHLRNNRWDDWAIEEPDESFLSSTFKIPPLEELSVSDMSACATFDVASGNTDRGAIRKLLLSLKETREEEDTQGTTAHKRARSDKSTVTPPAVSPVTAEGSAAAKRKRDPPVVMPPATPKVLKTVPKAAASTKPTARSRKKADLAVEAPPVKIDPPPKPARETRSTTSRKGKTKASSLAHVSDDDGRDDSADEVQAAQKRDTAPVLPDFKEDDEIDPDGPDFQVINGYVVSKFAPERKLIEWSTLLEEANETKKAKRHSLELIHRTFQHSILFKEYNPRSSFNVPDNWNPSPIPCIPFELVDHAFHVAGLEHAIFTDAISLVARLRLSWLHDASQESDLLFNVVAASQRRALQLHNLAREATEDLRHDLHQLLLHLRRATHVTGLKAARSRFTDVPKNQDILEVIDSRIRFLNENNEALGPIESDFEEEDDSSDDNDDRNPLKCALSPTSSLSYVDTLTSPTTPSEKKEEEEIADSAPEDLIPSPVKRKGSRAPNAVPV
ncbi:hypothetical protein C8J57DRAFT_1257968 [Mycena rebaudengoi]|nr:hypothetical protein C8J57DRAFT_1257968 [Mycena rebaudengoi]